MKKRIIAITISLFAAFVALDFYLVSQKKNEILVKSSLETKKDKNLISNEIYRLLFSLEEDMNFLLSVLKQSRNSTETEKLVKSFLIEHRFYFKIRLVNPQGRELLKILSPDDKNYKVDNELNQISDLSYFKKIKENNDEYFYFSFFEPNLIGEKIEKPFRSTLRVSKRVNLEGYGDSFFIVNIDAAPLMELITQSSSPKFGVLNDEAQMVGFDLSEISAQESTTTYSIASLDFFKKIKKHSNLDAPLKFGDHYYFLQEIRLPYSQDKWLLIAQTPKNFMDSIIKEDRLRILFWEIIVFLIIIGFVLYDTQRVQRQNVVEVLLKERTDFSHQVSHQLKTPLTIVLNELQQGSVELDRKEIISQIKHLIHVVDSLLLLAHVDHIKKLKMEKVSILDILNDVFDTLSVKIKDKNIKVSQNLSNEVADHPDVLDKFFSRDLMVSAFLNLIDNSIKYSPENTAIKVDISLEKNQLCLLICDKSGGVPENILPTLFQPFSKGHLGLSGSGLGLAIAKKIISLNGGTIAYQGDSKGAVFKILF